MGPGRQDLSEEKVREVTERYQWLDVPEKKVEKWKISKDSDVKKPEKKIEDGGKRKELTDAELLEIEEQNTLRKSLGPKPLRI
jgi:hypothetical protein